MALTHSGRHSSFSQTKLTSKLFRRRSLAMEHLAALFAEIGVSKSRNEEQPAAHQEGSSDSRDTLDTRDLEDGTVRDLGDTTKSRRPRDTTRSIRNSPRDASRTTRNSHREHRESREVRETRESKDAREPHATRDVREARICPEGDTAPPPYQEVADGYAPPPIEPEENHPSGIRPTHRCVKDVISTPVDWVIHPSAPHFLICGRCYVDRIYSTQQWPREFVKYQPSTGLSLRCHLGAIPHMAKRWSKVHTTEEFLSFLKIMQRKRVARHCPGLTHPNGNITWYSTSSIPGIRICQECHQQLFGGTAFSKHFFLCDEPPISSVCHGSFNYTKRMVDVLFELDDCSWEHFAEEMLIRIQLPSCLNLRRDSISNNTGSWYRYTRRGENSRDLHICEACFLDYVYQTDMENSFALDYLSSTKPRCMASLEQNQVPDMPDIEHGRAEILRLLHGTDMRCYAQGTVGVKWYTIRSNPRIYGVCEGCYLSKIKPFGGSEHYIPKRDVGRRTSFACWMNFYHPFFRRHQKLLPEALILGDFKRLESSIIKFSRMAGCQQGGMGQGKNKRWWGWGCLRICAACVKGGNLLDTPSGKKFDLNGEKDPYYRFCDLYSLQMRDRFHKHEISTLLEFARKRQEILA